MGAAYFSPLGGPAAAMAGRRLLVLALACCLFSGSLAAAPPAELCDALGGPRKRCGEVVGGAACSGGGGGQGAGPAALVAAHAHGSGLLRTWQRPAAHTACPPPPRRCRAGTDATGSEECAELGCCWSFPSPLRLEAWQPDVYQPACYFANGGNSTYTVVNATSADLIESGFYGAPPVLPNLPTRKLALLCMLAGWLPFACTPGPGCPPRCSRRQGMPAAC